MPTIYWDESSRGYHGNQGRTPYTRGRWVGEKMEKGRRIRMRSTDYDKVVAWVNGEKPERKGIALKGLPGYSIDVQRREVYGKAGRVIKSYTVHNTVKYELRKDRVSYHVSWNRMAYAALHDIDVLKIPSDIVVEERGGEYVLTYVGEWSMQKNAQLRTQRRGLIHDTLSKRKREIEILQRYYHTLDTSELVTYATTECFDGLLRYIMKERSCTVEYARDIVLEATERFLHRVTSQNIPVISISCTIKSLCSQALRDNRKKKEFYENLKIIEL